MKLQQNIWDNDKGFIWMLIIVVVSLMTSQLSEGILIESKLMVRAGFFLLTIVAIRSSSLSSMRKSIGYAIATALLLIAVIMLWSEPTWLVLLYTLCATSYMIFIIVLVVNQIFAGGLITVNKILGGVATYIIIGHLWATFYITIYIINPAAFQHGGELITHDEAVKHLSYFSFVTLTTIGYGDIIALDAISRTLAILEGLIGQLFPAIFIAKLVSLQIEDAKK
jgi:hypothetical protein